jgi:hypothetical protein
VKVTKVHSNHARAEEVERLEADDEPVEEADDEAGETDGEAAADEDAEDDRPQLGSRDNFWGG